MTGLYRSCSSDGIPDIQGLSSIDVHVTQAHDIRKISHTLLPSRSIFCNCLPTVQLPRSNIFDSQMQIHTGSQKYDVILAKEFQHHLTKDHLQNGVIYQGKNNK